MRLTRNVAAVTMDLDGIEQANVRALGGADNVTVGDLTGTGLKTANVDLAAFDGGRRRRGRHRHRSTAATRPSGSASPARARRW